MGNLGSPISGGLFHQSSVGSVTGVVLDDGRSVVIKGPCLLTSAGDALWPAPLSKLFDFAASAKGAEWIDDVAKRTMKHVRFLANTPVVALDWDGVCCGREPALIGTVAHGFCGDWSQGGNRAAPSLQEARAFIRDYGRARGKFSQPRSKACVVPVLPTQAYGTMRLCRRRGRTRNTRDPPASRLERTQ
jgi:hypothetical protein